MRDCVILINDRLVSLSHNSLLLVQPPTSSQSSSPICVRVLIRVVGTVGTVEKVFFVCRVLDTERLIVLVHDVFERGSSVLTNHWHSPSERLHHLRISSLTASNSADSVTSDSRTLTPRNPLENFFFFRDDSRGVVAHACSGLC